MPGSERFIMKTILVIDDDKMNLDRDEYILQQEGFNVVTAQSGIEGISAMCEGGIDLVLLDIDMPEINGIQTLKAIRAREEFSNIPVVFLTSIADFDHVKEAGRLGAVDYVRKPFRKQDLVDRVNKILGC